MSWWTDLLSRWRRRPPVALELPARVDIIPGKLAAHVHAHQLDTARGPVPCWTYVTEGLAELKHRELVFTLRREPGEPVTAVPRAPLAFFATAYQLAFRGRPVDIGDVTQTGGTRFFGGHAIYVEPQPLPGVPLPPSSMAVLAVSDLELRACRAFGFTRVLALRAEATATYPFPPWCDRRRADSLTPAFFEQSLLAKLPIAPTAPHLSARLEGERLVLTAVRGSWQERVAKLPVARPLAFTTGFDPEADSCLLWKPGQETRATLAPPDRTAAARPCGAFLAIHPQQPADTIAVAEDGFVAKLTADSWIALHTALVAGERFERALATTDDSPAELRFVALDWRAPAGD